MKRFNNPWQQKSISGKFCSPKHIDLGSDPIEYKGFNIYVEPFSCYVEQNGILLSQTVTENGAKRMIDNPCSYLHRITQ